VAGRCGAADEAVDNSGGTRVHGLWVMDVTTTRFEIGMDGFGNYVVHREPRIHEI
jgi:hypothetical protein